MLGIMRKIVVTCDRCGREINGLPIRISTQYINRETGDIMPISAGRAPYEESLENEIYCRICVASLLVNRLAQQDGEMGKHYIFLQEAASLEGIDWKVYKDRIRRMEKAGKITTRRCVNPKSGKLKKMVPISVLSNEAYKKFKNSHKSEKMVK